MLDKMDSFERELQSVSETEGMLLHSLSPPWEKDVRAEVCVCVFSVLSANFFFKSFFYYPTCFQRAKQSLVKECL